MASSFEPAAGPPHSEALIRALAQAQALGAAKRRESRLAATARLARSVALELTVIFALMLRFAPEPYNLGSFLLLSAIAFTSRRGTILALAGGWFAHSVNPGLTEEIPFSAGARFLVIAAAIVAAAYRWMAQRGKQMSVVSTASVGIVAALIVIHSGFISVHPSISAFKAILWGAVSLTLASTLKSMNDQEFRDLHRSLLIFLAVVLIGSLLTTPLPAARLRNGVGLQGLLNHPQMFGVFCGIAGAYFFGTAFSVPRPSWLAILMVALSLHGVLDSGARTGGLALVLACAAVVAVTLSQGTLAMNTIAPGVFSRRFGLLCFVATGVALANASMVRETVSTFINKREEAREVGNAYDASRGFVIDAMRRNIERYPIVGIGLSVPSSINFMEVERDESTGIVLSAPVEKGVMWLAVIEEFGILMGVGIIAWVMFGTARSLWVASAPAAASIAYFLSNFAEATFFSPGGIGMLGLIIFYIGLARPASKWSTRAPIAAPAPPSG